MLRTLGPWFDELHGHAYTVGPRLLYGPRVTPPPTVPWSRTVREQGRDLEVSGLLSEQPTANVLVVIMHGCGGTPNSLYAVLAARHFFKAGHSVLRLAWRGADGRGEDLYHAAQTGDVHSALSCAAFARYERIWLLGYSLGGHCMLHVAHENRDPRVRAVAAVCPVLHLAETNDAIDHDKRAFYRRYVLSGLKKAYRPLAKRGRAPTPFSDVRDADTFRIYDGLTVVPRYGFASVDDYYARACASRVLARIDTPTLIVSARHDPMLPWQIADRLRPKMAPAITFRWAERGGHSGFPRDLDIGERGARGLEAQLGTWLERQS